MTNEQWEPITSQEFLEEILGHVSRNYQFRRRVAVGPGTDPVTPADPSVTTRLYTQDFNKHDAQPRKGIITYHYTSYDSEASSTLVRPYWNTTSIATATTQLEALRAGDDKITLWRPSINIRAFNNGSTIGATFLSKVQDIYDIAASVGMLVIPRWCYDVEGNGDNASLAIALGHTSDAAATMVANEHMNYAVEGGISPGAWGEQHNFISGTGTVFTHDPWWGCNNNVWNCTSPVSGEDIYQRRQDLNEAALSQWGNVYVGSRTPRYKMRMLWDNVGIAASRPNGGALTAAHAERIYNFDDCMLNGSTHGGTYLSSTVAVEKSYQEAWVHDSTQPLPFGGETCALNTTTANPTDARTFFQQVGITYLNGFFHVGQIDYWKAQAAGDGGTGSFWDEMRRNIGYRFVMTQSTIQDSCAPGYVASVQLKVKNTGWGRYVSHNQPLVEVILENTATGTIWRADVTAVTGGTSTTQWDCRQWEAARDSSPVNTLDCEIAVPASVPAGNYKVHIGIRERNAALKTDSNYKVWFANTAPDPYDSTNGWNWTGHIMAVTPGGPQVAGSGSEVTLVAD